MLRHAFSSLATKLVAVGLLVLVFESALPTNATSAVANWAANELLPVSSPGASATLFSVSCADTSFCVAGGFYTVLNAHQAQPFVTDWNGKTWGAREIDLSSIQGLGGQIQEVECVSSIFCVAGGFYSDGSGRSRALVSMWNGISWRSHEVAALLTAGDSAGINSISCSAATFCVAGGDFRDGSGRTQAFVSIWNGKSWRDQEIATSLNKGVFAEASSVSCSSPAFCVAGGFYIDSFGKDRAFVSVWNGKSWRDQEIATSLNEGGMGAVSTVKCTSLTFCVAGGSFAGNSRTTQAFVSVWNGKSWRDQEIATSLNNGVLGGVTSVACYGATHCVAGGSYMSNSTASQAFVSVWNGKSWRDKEVATSLNKGGNATISSTACASATCCIAAGYFGDRPSNSQGLQAFVSVWNGKSWRDLELAALLDKGDHGLATSGSCPNAKSCIAIGNYVDGSGISEAFSSVGAAS